MAKYRITSDGQYALEFIEFLTDEGHPAKTRRAIAKDSEQWIEEIQPWLDQGNTFDPEILPEEQAAEDALTQKQIFLEQLVGTDQVLLKLIIEIYKTLQSKGIIAKADLGDALVDEAQALRQALNNYEAL